MNPAPPSGDDRRDHREGGWSVDDTLAILQHQHRRDVIDYCSSAERRTVELEDLVDYIAGKRGSAADRDQIAANLHHTHLPRLAKKKVIEWDPRSGQLRYFENDQLEQWVARIHKLSSE